MQSLALELDLNIGDGEMVLDVLRPATSSRLDVVGATDTAPADTEVQGEVVYNRLVARVGWEAEGRSRGVGITNWTRSTLGFNTRHRNCVHVEPLRFAVSQRWTVLLVDGPGFLISTGVFCGEFILNPGARLATSVGNVRGGVLDEYHPLTIHPLVLFRLDRLNGCELGLIDVEVDGGFISGSFSTSCRGSRDGHARPGLIAVEARGLTREGRHAKRALMSSTWRHGKDGRRGAVEERHCGWLVLIFSVDIQRLWLENLGLEAKLNEMAWNNWSRAGERDRRWRAVKLGYEMTMGRPIDLRGLGILDNQGEGRVDDGIDGGAMVMAEAICCREERRSMGMQVADNGVMDKDRAQSMDE